jgi:uncharacterized SAM-binding protein YcdF (DUF218 family)
MFLLKKIIGPFFLPLTVCLFIFLVGLFFLWFRKRRFLGTFWVTISFILLVLLSYSPVPHALLRPLESRYPPLTHLDQIPKVRWIVVLGGGHCSDPNIGMVSQLSGSTLFRLVEGIRLHRALPDTRLILSGGAIFDTVAEAQSMENLALALGVEREKIVLDLHSRDTEEQSERIQKIVRKEPFILVTSAAHMPRAMALFQKIGLQAIPAPTDYGVKQNPRPHLSPSMFFPNPEEWAKAQGAVYEYLGLAWAKLRGRI